MRFEVLGPLVVTARDKVRLERRSHRRLLAILLLERDGPLDADALADRFWSEDPPPTARAALQTHISQLRRRLGSELVVTDTLGYRLNLDGHRLDAVEFMALASATRHGMREGRWDEVAEATSRALALWRGAPYPDLEADPFAAAAVARLEEERADLVELRGEALLALGRNEEAVPDLEGAVRELPYRERLWQHLMLARTRLGRTAEALEAYHEARRQLSEIGLDPGPALRELEERILREDPDVVPPRGRGNLPARRTNFIGRGLELNELEATLAAHRLVTLTGTGGSGKTRLAVELAGRIQARFPDGTWMVDLAQLSDPDLVTVQAAMALGLRPSADSVIHALTQSLRSRELLVILDNCEHVLAGATSTVDALLEAGPGVRILATSRTPLGATGELTYDVPPLPVPPGDAPLSAAAAVDAVQLFADRAALVVPGFRLTDANAGSVAAICRRLDGLPLAIELAASRLNAVAPDDLAERLDHRFRLLAQSNAGAPARHRTLEATVAWSYDLLDRQQQALFLRLGVFAGSFSLAMAESVCPGGSVHRHEVASLLVALVERSLVTSEASADQRRYRLLETIRQFARDRLAAADERALVEQRHRDHFLAIAQRRVESPQWDWVAAVSSSADDIEVALAWSLGAGQAREAAVLAAALGEYRDLIGHPHRAVAQLRATLRACDLRSEPERAADLHVVLSGALHAAGDSQGAFEAAELAQGLLAERPPSVEKLMALVNASALHRMLVQRDPRDAIAPAVEALRVAEALDDRRATRLAHSNLGSALGWSGAIDEGLEHNRRALAIAEELGNAQLVLTSYANLMTQVMLHPQQRRTEPPHIAHEIVARFGDDPTLATFVPWGWIGYSHLLSGEWERVEDVVRTMANRRPEGFELTHVQHVRGCLRWMQGRLSDAAAEARAADSSDLSERWYHDIFDLQASVAADAGDLEQVRVTAARYLRTEVHPAEASMKSAVLRSLVRAEVDAALAASGDVREEHARLARDAQQRMRDLVAAFPHPSGGSVQLETADANLRIGQAELSRLGDPRPELWASAEEAATFAYWKLYAAWRRAEALLQLGAADGPQALRDAHRRASSLGASLIRERLGELAAAHDLEVAA